MKLIWSDEAEKSLDGIFTFIAEDNVDAAINMDNLFREKAKELMTFPNLGKPGQVEGTSELILHPNYKLIYTVRDDFVWIITIVNTAMNYPWK